MARNASCYVLDPSGSPSPTHGAWLIAHGSTCPMHACMHARVRAGDLTSTAVAALAINYVDVHHLHQAVLRRERKAGGSGPNPSA